MQQLEKSTSQLTDIERRFLLRLTASERRDRLSHSSEICSALSDVVAALEFGGNFNDISRPLVLVIDPKSNDTLLSRCIENGFLPNPADSKEAFNPNDMIHTSNLTAFIQADLSDAQLYAIPNTEVRLLVGRELELKVGPFQSYGNDGEQLSTWDIAFCFAAAELRRNDGGSACKDVPQSVIVVRTKRQTAKDRSIRQQAQSWEPFLPHIDQIEQLRASLRRFHEFIRCTNQLELLMRDAEVFAFDLVSHRVDDDGVEHATIRETQRRRPPFRFFKIEGGLKEFLHREIETGKQFCRNVVLTPLGGV